MYFLGRYVIYETMQSRRNANAAIYNRSTTRQVLGNPLKDALGGYNHKQRFRTAQCGHLGMLHGTSNGGRGAAERLRPMLDAGAGTRV